MKQDRDELRRPDPAVTGTGVLVSNPWSASLQETDMPAAPQSDPLLGTTLAGRFHIQKKLGEGGSGGAVYLATHNALGKPLNILTWVVDHRNLAT